MADAMVTGRMSQAKKQTGGRVLKSLGMSASQAINQLYDYLITHDASPFDSMADKPAETARLEDALTFARSLPRKNQFSHMSDAEIKRSKLAAKGFVPSNGGEH